VDIHAVLKKPMVGWYEKEKKKKRKKDLQTHNVSPS
jgi:hypothetical protein